MILALDLATNIGWASGDGTSRPRFGSHRLPSTGDDVGAFLLAFESWLAPQVCEGGVSLVVFETPILPRGTSFKTVTKLHSLAGLAEMICSRAAVRVRSTQPAIVKKSWVGKGNAKKPQMMARAQALGFDVQDSDQADALAIWFHVLSASRQITSEALVSGWRHG